jgi:energy-coupling factor transport system ATP-binding protein
MNPAVSCQELHFTYESSDKPVLNGVDIEIQQGEFAVIAGPSGAGKSTFCRTLNNVIPLYYKGNLTGRRQIAGETLQQQPIASLARKVGMVFQDFEQQLFSTSALLELVFGLENFGVQPSEMRERIAGLLKNFGLQHLARREPFSLSGGEKQKLAIASVIACKPPILVLDEPTTDLDPESKEFVLNFLPELKDWVETLIVVDIETEQFQTADKVYLFNEGRVSAQALSAEILTNSKLLTENSLRPLDLVRIQELLKQKPKLLSVPDMLDTLARYRLEPSPVPGRLTTAPAIVVENLTYRYRDQETDALKNVCLEIREGEFAGIIGRNGSGKSTLLRHLNGLQLPQKGSVRVFDEDTALWDHRKLAREVGLVFQNPDHQIFNTTVRAELEFGPRLFHLPEEQVQANVRKAVEAMDLTSQLERDPFQLSKGERQRVAVASVLSLTPRILILDEPTTGLDYRQQKYLMELLRDLNHQGATIVIVTHALKLVAEYCDYCVVLSSGSSISEGHPRSVFFSGSGMKLPPLLELSAGMNGNALTADEFVQNLRMR